MPAFDDWFPYAATGTMCLAFGVLKLIGLRKGIVGGAGQPLGRRLCGTWPSWTSRGQRLGLPLLFLVIAAVELTFLAMAFARPGE